MGRLKVVLLAVLVAGCMAWCAGCGTSAQLTRNVELVEGVSANVPEGWDETVVDEESAEGTQTKFWRFDEPDGDGYLEIRASTDPARHLDQKGFVTAKGLEVTGEDGLAHWNVHPVKDKMVGDDWATVYQVGYNGESGENTTSCFAYLPFGDAGSVDIMTNNDLPLIHGVLESMTLS